MIHMQFSDGFPRWICPILLEASVKNEREKEVEHNMSTSVIQLTQVLMPRIGGLSLWRFSVWPFVITVLVLPSFRFSVRQFLRTVLISSAQPLYVCYFVRKVLDLSF